MQNRRTFIKNISYGTAALGIASVPFEVFAAKHLTRIAVLHTNDVHSRIDPFPDNDPKFAGMGGVAQRAFVINRIRSEEEHVLLLDAGDIFQGTPYFNMYGGEVELKAMSMMNYDASAIGNHDFDKGIEGLVKQMPHATFPFLSANYDFSKTDLAGKTLSYKIFEKGNVRIGVFGLGIELQGLVDKKLYGNTVYLDPMVKSAEMAHLLKKEKKCDIVICLSHLGYKYEDEKISDMVLAKKSANIDLIIGGHTHTFIDEPLRVMNRDGKSVLVAQAGWAGVKLGRIDFFVEKSSGKISAQGSTEKIMTKSS